MAFYEGSKMRITIGTKNVFHETDATLNEGRDFKELASKDIDGKDYTPGATSWSLSSSAYAANGASTQEDLKSLLDAFDAKELVDIAFTDGETGNITFTGQAYIENYSIKSANEEAVTFDYALKGKGLLAKALN